jgi:endonuclease G
MYTPSGGIVMLAHFRIAVIVCVFLFPIGQLRADDGDEHLVMGNISGAVADRDKPDNFLLKKRQYALSYNNSKGTANWVSWHLNKSWLGRAHRTDAFAPDTSLPRRFFMARPNDYKARGFDRGHQCPAADRGVTKEDMDATFLMTNMVPQAPDLNRHTWEKLETYCRDQARERASELYIVTGPAGQGGTGSDGYREYLGGAKGKIVVPSKCWKVVLVLPPGITDPRKVTTENARVFAVIMPNTQGLGPNWREYAVPVNEVEKLTGFTFFGNLPRDLADELRSRKPETRAVAERSEPKRIARKERRGKELEMPAWEKGCIIGNHETRKYHVPGGRHYEMAKKSKNAVFFKNEEDAKKAGYTHAK